MLACAHPAFDGPVILFQNIIEVQWFAGECRRDQTKENDCPKHEDAIISDLAGPSKSVPRFALIFAGSSSCLYRAARDSHGRGESQNWETLEKWLREALETKTPWQSDRSI